MKKYIFSLFAIVAAMTFTACSSEDEQVAELLNAQQVYFPNTLSNTFEITADASSVEIPVMRMGTDAASIPVQVTLGEENAVELSAPSSVEFASGSQQSAIVISYNPEKVEPGHYDNITLSFGDEYNTPYGNSSVTLKVGQAEPWVSLGRGQLIDNWVFGGSSSVEIQQNQLFPNRFRVVYPFKEIALANGSEPADGFTEYMNITVYNAGDVYQDVEIQHDGLVIFSDCNTGYYHSSNDADIYMLHPSRFTSLTYDNWLNNRVTQYQENGLPAVINIAPMFYMFGVGGWNETATNGDVIITFPGVVLADYSVEVETVGRLIDKKENGKAVFQINLGEDVASAKVAFAAGKDANVAYEMILNDDESVVTLNASGEVRFAYDEPGDYVCVAAACDAEGNIQNVGYSLINIPAGGESEVFEAVFSGVYTHGVQNLSSGDLPFGESFEDEATLYVSTSDDTRCLISPWINKGYEETESLGEGMLFIWDDEDNITVPMSYTGVNTSYGEMWAWDLVTAGVADIPCEFDEDTYTLTFYLAWSVEAGHFGFTADTYEITGYAAKKSNAPERMKIKKSFAKKLSSAKNSPAMRHLHPTKFGCKLNPAKR